MSKRLIAAVAHGLACAAALLPLARAAAAPAEIPFRLEGHNIVVEVEIGRQRHLPFAVDTGLSSGNIITPRAARSLGLKAERDLGVRDAAGERRPARWATVPAMRIGGVALQQVPFAITRIPGKVIRRPGGGVLAGFVGAPLLRDAVLCIDYGQGMIHHWDRAEFDAAGLVPVPMSLNHGLPTIGVQIDGRAATLIVDSGAEPAVAVYAAFAAANDFGRRYRALGGGSGNGGGGRSFPSLLTEAGTVELGSGAEFANVPLQVIPQGMDPRWGIDGVIGFQMLKQLDPCLDRDGGRFLYRGE